VSQADSVEATAEVPDEHVFAVLRERLYGAISCLATLAILARYTTDDTSAWARILDVAVATGALWAASLFADFVAHLGVYGQAPDRRSALGMLQASGQILQAAVLPVAVLAAAGLGLLHIYTAMLVAMWAVVGELALIALLAVRKSELLWWQKLFTVLGLTLVGVVVVVVKILAH